MTLELSLKNSSLSMRALRLLFKNIRTLLTGHVNLKSQSIQNNSQLISHLSRITLTQSQCLK
jgi:hypothetical protein